MFALAAVAITAALFVFGMIQLGAAVEPESRSAVLVPTHVDQRADSFDTEHGEPAAPPETSPTTLEPAPLVVTSPLAPTGRLAGRIVDEAGRPQDEATVAVHEATRFPLTLRGLHPIIEQAPTRADGSFETGPLLAGRSLILFVEVGRRPAGIFEGFMAVPGSRLDVGELVVAGPVTATGRVEDEQGHPLAGATVVAGSFVQDLSRGVSAIREGRPQAEWVVSSASTDADGAYVLADLPAGLVRIGALSPGLAESWTTLSARPGPVEVPILRLGAWRSVSGRVVSHDRQPAVGALVNATVQGWPGTLPTVATGTDGRFTLRGPAGESVQLHARDAQREVRQRLTVSPFVDEVEIRLEPPDPDPELTLRVVQSNGNPVAPFQAWWFAPDDSTGVDAFPLPDGWNMLGASSGNGNELVISRPDEGLLFVSASGLSSRLVPVPAPDLESSPLNIVVEDDQPITGLVVDRDSGQPIPGAELRVLLQRSDQAVPGAVVWSDERGRFRLASLPLATLRLVARADNHLEIQTVIARSDRDGVSLALPPAGTLIITVKASVRGRCTPPYSARITDDTGKVAWSASSLQATSVAGPLTPGHYRVRADGRIGALEASVTVEAGRVSTVNLE